MRRSDYVQVRLEGMLTRPPEVSESATDRRSRSAATLEPAISMRTTGAQLALSLRLVVLGGMQPASGTEYTSANHAGVDTLYDAK